MTAFLRTASGILLVSSGWAMSLSVKPSIAEPVKVGTPVTIKAQAEQPPAPGAIWYRFRIRGSNSQRLRTVRDFSPVNSFDWVPLDGEGVYEIQVSARHVQSGETVDTTTLYRVDTLVQGGQPLITPTRNKLVFLYSAPPCPTGSTIRVQFTRVGEGTRTQSAPPVTCTGNTSRNMYIAGLRQQSEYRVHQTIRSADGVETTGPDLSLTTGTVDIPVPVTRSLGQQAGRSAEEFLLQSSPFTINTATDLEGHLVWYNPSTDIRYLTRAEPGGLFVAELDDWSGDASKQLLRLIDVAGNIVAETNAGRINELLEARREAPITSFHHDARLMPGGRFLVLAGTERLVTEMQGDAEVDVLGDAILVLDRDLQIEWSWNAFDHMDVRREALLSETCSFGTGGCPVFWLAPVANDWLHGNSVQLTPDGNILYSARHQDWLLKIDYANGFGSGNIIWRLGRDGDFNAESSDPLPWFSHQHDGNFELDAPDRLMVFDNGNTRWERDKSTHSRGQVWVLDEETRTAKLVFNADLGDYSLALGWPKLSNGNYQFGLGWDSRNFSQSFEFDPSGQLVAHTETETQMYRSYRLADLYARGLRTAQIKYNRRSFSFPLLVGAGLNASGFGRRAFLCGVGGAFVTSVAGKIARAQSAAKPPNVIVIFADDLGYGDVGCFGSSIPTPNLDRMAEEGVRLTRFYSASPVCSPSRAALLTGRYPARTGIVNVLMPSSPIGLVPLNEPFPGC